MIFNYMVTKDYDNKSLRFYLEDMHLSKKKIYSLFLEKKISLNSLFVNERSILKEYDIISIIEEEKLNFKPYDYKIDIVYEDDYLLILNKPSNMIIYSLNNEENTLCNAVANYYIENNYDISVKYAHRLDKDTTGLIVFCKDSLSHSYMNYLFENHKLNKYYLLFVNGILKNKKERISLGIGKDRHINNKMIVNENNDLAITHYKVIKEYKDYSLVLVRLETGKTHQIRVHFSYLGHPLLGDTLYGDKTNYIPRVALHSYCLEFIHPVYKEKVRFEIDLNADMKALGGEYAIW